MTSKLITIKEVSEILGISEDEIRVLVEKNEIPHYLVGGKFLRFRVDEISPLKDKFKRAALRRREKPSAGEKIADFLYFYDYYIVTLLVAAAILGVVVWRIMR